MARSAKKPRIPKEISFDFIKSNFFRVIRADGVFGGIAPNGSLHMALFSERKPIPTRMIHSVENGRLGPEIKEKRQERNAIVREVEVDIALGINEAVLMRNWLNEKIEQYENIVGPIQNVTQETKDDGARVAKKFDRSAK